MLAYERIVREQLKVPPFGQPAIRKGAGQCVSLARRVACGAKMVPSDRMRKAVRYRGHDAKEQIVDRLTVPLTVVTSRTEAELIVGLLGSNGLRAAVSADDA